MIQHITVLEAYTEILKRGDVWRTRAKIAREKGHEDNADDFENTAQDYYWCAALLERTKEVNP